jgi:hypothetical protein
MAVHSIETKGRNMIGFLRAKAQLRAVSKVLASTMPQAHHPDPVQHASALIAALQTRAQIAEREAERLRRTYEPSRERIVLEGNVTVVQPTGGARFTR